MTAATPTTRAPPGPADSPAWSSSITCPAGTSGSSRWRASSPITAMRRSRRTFTSVTAPAARTTSAPGCGRRAAGGGADEQVMGDVAGSIKFLRAQPHSNGKVGIIGFCSGGRLAYLAAGSVRGIDATVDCWGGSVIVKDKKQLDAKRPVAPIDLTDKITCPLLGIFGNEDKTPDIEQVNETEQALRQLGKTYEFHRYDGVGHAFFNTWRDGYRAPQALDGWDKVFGFYQRYLASA